MIAQTKRDDRSVMESREERFRHLKQEVHQHLINSMDLSTVSTLDDYRLRSELKSGIEDLCRFRADLLTEAERKRLVDEVIDETLGLGPLEVLLRDPTVSDILINGPTEIYVERRGQLESTTVRFHDEDHLVEIIQRIASKVGRRLDESSPMVDARLEDGSRVNAVIRPLAIDGALVSIRRFGRKRLESSDLVSRQSITREMLDFLTACVQARLNIVISGGTGSGKSTLLNVLSSAIPPTQRIATIEDAAELQLQQPHVARMETRPANVEGTGCVTARDLLRNSLRMRPDRIIVGECRGEEAFDMLQAMTTGHDGSFTTIHANGSRHALRRIEMLVRMAGYELPIAFIRELIASAIQIVVHCERMSDGIRRVTAITEVTGLVGDSISTHDLFAFKQRMDRQGEGPLGDFVATGIRPQCLSFLQSKGFSLGPEFFEQRVLADDRCDRIPHASRFQGDS